MECKSRQSPTVPVRVVVAEEVEANKDSDQEQNDDSAHHHTHNQQQRYGVLIWLYEGCRVRESF